MRLDTGIALLWRRFPPFQFGTSYGHVEPRAHFLFKIAHLAALPQVEKEGPRKSCVECTRILNLNVHSVYFYN